jgi:hypothetical protein
MPAAFEFAHRLDFTPADSDAILRQIPAAPGVFSLRGEAGEPYLTRTADLRRRLRRILAPPEALNPDGTPVLSKRLNLRNKVRFVDYTRTGSDFESTLVLYRATRAAFGPEEARRRLRLHAPYFLRITMQHAHPRVYATNKLSRKSLAESFGPFPSRAAAERYCDAVLDLFQLRRCHEELAPFPDHPGCVFGEMNKCMRPCQEGNALACTPRQYADEATRVHAFFSTRGESLLSEIAQQRDAASEAMDFEQAATLHKHWEKVRAATLLADELVRPVPQLRAVILQESAPPDTAEASAEVTPPGAPGSDSGTRVSTSSRLALTDEAAVFLLHNGHLVGPARLSTLGVRAVREQTAVGSSLFAQPLMLAPIPLDEPSGTLSAVVSTANPTQTVISTEAQRSGETPVFDPPPSQIEATNQTPEDRARKLLTHLETLTQTPADIPETCDHLALFRRWYYRPEKQRQGEAFLPNPDGSWPIRRILNGAARIVLGPPTAAPAVDREAAKILKTKIIHAGREGVEREVPVLPKRKRTRKAITPAELTE